jgi:hypothetical protein
MKGDEFHVWEANKPIRPISPPSLILVNDPTVLTDSPLQGMLQTLQSPAALTHNHTVLKNGRASLLHCVSLGRVVKPRASPDLGIGPLRGRLQRRVGRLGGHQEGVIDCSIGCPPSTDHHPCSKVELISRYTWSVAEGIRRPSGRCAACATATRHEFKRGWTRCV